MDIKIGGFELVRDRNGGKKHPFLSVLPPWHGTAFIRPFSAFLLNFRL